MSLRILFFSAKMIPPIKMTETVAIEADLLRVGFQLGYYSKDDLAGWADRQIAIVDEPSLELITLSMNKRVDPHDLLMLLRSIGQTDDQQKIFTEISFIGLLYTSERIPTGEAIRLLWLLVDEPGVTDEQESFIHSIDQDYYLIIEGIYGKMADVDLELCAFFTTYTDDLVLSHSQLFSDIK